MRRLILIVFSLLPRLLLAQADSASRGTPSGHTRVIMPIGGLHFGAPARYALAVGAMYGWRDEITGPFALIEGGRNAGRVSVGYVRLPGNLATGLSGRASFLRIYSGRAPANYAGVEGQAIALGLGLRLGIFRPLKGGRTLITTDFSWML